MALYDVFSELAGYVDFQAADAERLAEMAPMVGPAIPEIVAAFYDAIERSAGASKVFEDHHQVERLKASLERWLERFFSGVYDEEYVAARARIGMVHVGIGLDQRYMFAAMNVIRRGIDRALVSAARQAGWPQERILAGVDAVAKLCDLELAIMLETYSLTANERFRVNERLAAIGQIAGSVAHELRNPLATIAMSTTLLSKKTSEERSRKQAERIAAQVRYSMGVIDGLLALTRDQAPSRRLVDVEGVVRDALDSIRPRSGVEISTDIEPGLPAVSVDPVQLQQVVINLVTNAMQAISGEGRSGRVHVHTEMRGSDLVVKVDDDGPGLSPDVKARLFEPLFTTRLKGVGLGLALCRRIAERHGGELRATNREPGGASFVVTFQASPSP